MSAVKIGSQLITDFRTLIDEQDDLSDTQVLDLAQQTIDIINNEKDWTYLVKTAVGTLTTTDLSYALETDFRGLTENWEDEDFTPQRILFVGTNFERYRWIDMSQRRNVRESNGYAYIDFAQLKFFLTKLEQTSRSFEYDYIHNPVDITLTTSPVIPVNFQKAIPKFMAVLWADIDQTDKSFSYALENNREYIDYIDTMKQQDAQHDNQFYVGTDLRL